MISFMNVAFIIDDTKVDSLSRNTDVSKYINPEKNEDRYSIMCIWHNSNINNNNNKIRIE